MSLADEYRAQWPWRAWPRIMEALPQLAGQTVLDLGCGPGDQAAALVARGARVIGLDASEELLQVARAHGLAGAEFHLRDLRGPLELPRELEVDGIWCSLAAAYFPDLAEALTRWSAPLRAGGWIALTELDELFAHEPLGERTRALLEGYMAEALAAGRYDFRMGRQLGEQLERAGFTTVQAMTVPDLEFAFDGPALPEVLEAWRARLARLTFLRDFCGAEHERVCSELLGCLARPDHRSLTRVCCVIATRAR